MLSQQTGAAVLASGKKIFLPMKTRCSPEERPSPDPWVGKPNRCMLSAVIAACCRCRER